MPDRSQTRLPSHLVRRSRVWSLAFRDEPGSAIEEEPRKELPMSGPSDAAAAPGQDEREIRALVDRMFDSWGRGDAVAYHADFTDDADYVSFDGSRRGKADSIASHQNLFRTVLYGSRLTGQVESIRLVTPDVAVVHLTGSVVEGWRQQLRRRQPSTTEPVRSTTA